MVIETGKTETDHYEWLTDYEVPMGTTLVSHGLLSSPLVLPAKTGETLPEVASAAIYLPESKSVKSGDNALKLQEYKVTIRTEEELLDGNKTTAVYTSTLPRLGSLFRNTHVKVNIVFNPLEWQVDVEPYWGVVLDPKFGLDDPKEKTNEFEKSQQI